MVFNRGLLVNLSIGIIVWFYISLGAKLGEGQRVGSGGELLVKRDKISYCSVRFGQQSLSNYPFGRV
jgi:hypothetical protein